MKIYPNKNAISIKSSINKSVNIPLAYIDTESQAVKIETEYNPDFLKEENEEVLPYDKVKTSMCLFDENGELIPYNDMVRNFIKGDNGYVYVPKNNSISFEPKTFDYKIRIKKNMKYRSNMIYNLSASFFDNKTYANRLMQIFGDAYSRNLAPGNVLINNGDLSIERLCSESIEKCDINFLYLKNMNTIDTDKSTKTFDRNDFADKNESNMFMILQDSNAVNIVNNTNYKKDIVNLLYTNAYKQYKINSPYIYSGKIYKSKYNFNIPPDTKDIKYHNIFNNSSSVPVLIEEHLNKCFMVYISESILENLTDNFSLIYEVLLYVYFNSYITSDTRTEWVADVMPDYIVRNNVLTKSNCSYNECFINDIINIDIQDIKSFNIILDTEKFPFVSYKFNGRNSIIFSKIKGEYNEYADPAEKPADYISLYSGNKIFYFKNFVYKINDSIKNCINITNDDEEITIKFSRFRNSDNGIYIKYIQEDIKIPLVQVINNIEVQINNKTYYIICRSSDSASSYEVIDKSDYTDGIILASIYISLDSEKNINTVFDMRVRGGGLPESEPDNFDCFDIGNLYGRPYRRGGTLIITLPAYLKEHRDFIMEIIKQYMISDDYPVLLFKEE